MRLAAGKRRCGKGRDWDMLFLLLWLVWSLPWDRAGHVPLLLRESRIEWDEGGGAQEICKNSVACSPPPASHTILLCFCNCC